MYIADLVSEFSDQNGVPNLIGWHGHTVFHFPEQHTTVQIGHPSAIANQLGVPVVSDFRQSDVYLGGQGAPLAPIVESSCLPGYDAYLNLGGIVNVSVHSNQTITGWDICACNQILNYVANWVGQPFDRNGELASSGTFLPDLCHHLDQIPFLAAETPKSLDNGYVQNQYLPRIESFRAYSVQDVLFTLTTHISQQVTQSLFEQFAQDEETKSVLLSGGGTFNAFLVKLMTKHLSEQNIEIHLPSKKVIEYKEALLMAIMAHKYVHREINVLQTVTGAESDSIGGTLSLPYNHNMKFTWE